MKLQFIVITVLSFFSGRVKSLDNYYPNDDPVPDFTNNLILSDGMSVTWEVYSELSKVIFEVKSNTRGWIGFGISYNAGMQEADLIMGGVDENGKSYFSDRYSKIFAQPVLDARQDWFLENAIENEDGTTLRFNRKFNTGDIDQDITIENKDTYFIWAQGSDDDITKQHQNRGKELINILHDPTKVNGTTLHLGNNYVLNWKVFNDNQTVVFDVVCNTKGWVALGISESGSMTNADLIMGGVDDDHDEYFDDRFASGHEEPDVDDSQDWELLSATESPEGSTHLRFQREFTTTDEFDVNITNENTYFIWSYGDSDDTSKRHVERGMIEINILDGEVISPVITTTTTTTTTPKPPTGASFRRSLVLSENLDVTWDVYELAKTVIFEVTSKTHGWIGFGVSKNGNMIPADLVMCGVTDNGTTYLTDRWATHTAMPSVDAHQDWFFVSGYEDDSVTSMKFQRTFNTGDGYEDLVFENKDTYFVWALGETDDVDEKHVERGNVVVNILDNETSSASNVLSTALMILMLLFITKFLN